MGSITLANDKGQIVQFLFEGKSTFKAHKDNKGTAFVDKTFHFVSTDQEHPDIPPPPKKED